MKVKVKQLHPNAKIPQYAKPGDAGLDLVAVDREINDKYIEYKTGLAFEIPEGYVGLLFPRSSITKYDLLLKNSVGVIDSSYRGEVLLRFYDAGENGEWDYYYNIGDKVGQLMILPYPSIELEKVEELSTTERGAGGYGSTGK